MATNKMFASVGIQKIAFRHVFAFSHFVSCPNKDVNLIPLLKGKLNKLHAVRRQRNLDLHASVVKNEQGRRLLQLGPLLTFVKLLPASDKWTDRWVLLTPHRRNPAPAPWQDWRISSDSFLQFHSFYRVPHFHTTPSSMLWKLPLTLWCSFRFSLYFFSGKKSCFPVLLFRRRLNVLSLYGNNRKKMQIPHCFGFIFVLFWVERRLIFFCCCCLFWFGRIIIYEMEFSEREGWQCRK